MHRTIAVCLIALTACAVAVPTVARNTNGRWNYLAADMRSGSRAFMRSETALCVVMKPMDGVSMTWIGSQKTATTACASTGNGSSFQTRR